MFVVCGEALMDIYPSSEDTPTGLLLDARVGGSPFNVAVGLARLAQPVAFFGAISTDIPGERLMRALQGEGVACDAVARPAAPTTLGFVGLDDQGSPAYTFHGEGAADRQLGMDALATLPPRMRALHVGSYATVVEPIASTLRALVAREHGRTPICFDPNIRPAVEPDIDRWRDLVRWMLPRCDLLKISEEDLQLLRPGVNLTHFAGAALAAGVGLVVVTRGSEGACAWSPTGEAQVEATAVEVVDSVGAGDAFQAALLAWLCEQDKLSLETLRSLGSEDMERALRFASDAAGIACGRRGADLPRRADLPAD
ncbi:carbohydrate kinase [Variovorax dokdonensis]|uniref:Carbohydrate kinase n=1 Tax=Variovorax dokdonensis TaxID=344883 RepID=A0ABT7N666_9BURK|nr:carbohydrate kinase [Variovorax dokdonensis]MDM0043370.1 carbohydrate kinase [Variovorax dokdonensis]